MSKLRHSLYLFVCLFVLTFSGCNYPQTNETIKAFPRLAVKGAPSDIASITLAVSGPGMAPLENTYTPPPASIEIEVPAGSERQFVLQAYVTGESALPAYSGTATADLTPGEATTIPIYLEFLGGKVYVSNYGSDNVSVIEEIRNSVIATIPVGTNPCGVGVNPITKKIYVAHYDEDISVIDGTTDTVIKTISYLGDDYPMVGVNPVTNRIYVAWQYDSYEVVVIDGNTDDIAPIEYIETDCYPNGIGINTVTNKIYIVDWGGSYVYVFDGNTDLYLTDIYPISSDEKGGIAVNSITNKIYVPVSRH